MSNGINTRYLLMPFEAITKFLTKNVLGPFCPFTIQSINLTLNISNAIYLNYMEGNYAHSSLMCCYKYLAQFGP
jgi:hypothetical protein